MGDVLEQLRELCAEVLGKGSPPFDDYADRALAIVLRSLVEECCAGAVVGTIGALHPFDGCSLLAATDGLWAPIPIAAAPASLADKVARWLAEVCANCESGDSCIACVHGAHKSTPPLAAAYTDAGGVRSYVLASAACQACEGSGNSRHVGVVCQVCSGTGARTDVSEIARRYGGEGTARLARFEVRG